MTARSKTKSFVIGMFSLACLVSPVWGQGQSESKTVNPIRVGSFDSRAVAIACYRSEKFKAELKQKFDQLKEFKAAGDEAKVKALEAEGPALQHHMHMQSFGTAPIKDVLLRVKPQLAEIGKQENVQVIVSQWDIAFQQSDVAMVDVTDALVQLFEPDEATLQVVKEIRAKKPVSAKVLKQHKH